MADKKISELPAAGAITGSELVPIVQSGGTVQSTVDAVKNGAVKVYRALLNQSGTNAPVATVLENTLGGTVVWSYSGVGFYTGTLVGAFALAKTFPTIGQVELTAICFAYPSVPPDSVAVSSNLTGPNTPVDGILFYSPLEILVYP